MTRQEKRAQVIALKQRGISNAEIAASTGLSVRGIQKINSTVKVTHSFKDRPRSGRPPKLTDRNCRSIGRMVKKKKQAPPQPLQRPSRPPTISTSVAKPSQGALNRWDTPAESRKRSRNSLRDTKRFDWRSQKSTRAGPQMIGRELCGPMSPGGIILWSCLTWEGVKFFENCPLLS